MNGSRFLGFAIIFAAMLICVGLIVGGFLIRSAPPPANTVRVDIPGGLVDGGVGHSIAVLGPDRVVYLDRDGRIYDISMQDGKPPFIREVYTVTHAPKRHAGNPEKRTLHGYYLDPATGERKAEIDHARRKFIDIASGRSVQIALDAAENLADMGEHEFLLQQLDTKAFAGRRAAALVLGKSGYIQAVPILIDMLGDSELGIRSSAADYLKKITGKDFVEDIKIEVQHKAVKKYKEWWESYQAEEKKKEK
ncbi:MAG: HEAT repeat domain-containing protein [Planctomycetota bacterium]|nr:MAG: HEAT repeat domain-containing protein [Planctomycetota bacterium]